MSKTLVMRGRLCETWNGGRVDESQLGLATEDGEVHILAQLVHEAVGREWSDVVLRFWLTDEPTRQEEREAKRAYGRRGRLHVRYWEHRQSAHGYEATEDYEPEQYLYTTETLEIDEVNLIRALTPFAGKHLHLEIEERE